MGIKGHGSSIATEILASISLIRQAISGMLAVSTLAAMIALFQMNASGMFKTRHAPVETEFKITQDPPSMNSWIKPNNAKMTYMSVSTKRLRQAIEHLGLHPLTLK